MFYKADLVCMFQVTLKGHKKLLSWLTIGRTQLLPKYEYTHITKNYRPIAYQNIIFKLYTSCINTFDKSIVKLMILLSFTSNLTEYKNSIFQGDGISVLLY